VIVFRLAASHKQFVGGCLTILLLPVDPVCCFVALVVEHLETWIEVRHPFGWRLDLVVG
jgi:hypothetical protein